MKLKKIISKTLIGLCTISMIALFLVMLSGCTTSINHASRNLNNYNLNIDYNDSLQILTCSEEIDYINTSDTTLNYLAFHLYPNAFRKESISPPVNLSNQYKAYPNGLSYGYIEINSVSVLHNTATYCDTIQIAQPSYRDVINFLKNNNTSNSQHFIGGEDQNILYIIFPDKLFPDERINININFIVKLPNINHRFGYGNNTINISNFYPIACVFDNGEFNTSLYHYNGDPFYSDMANYETTFKCFTDYTVANTGEIIDHNKEIITETKYLNSESDEKTLETMECQTEKNIYKIKAKVVRDFSIILSKEFKVISKIIDETEVKYYYFSDENPNLSLETASEALTTFNELIGKYPYSTLSVVEANFVHGGMEYPNLVYISNELSNQPIYQQVIVHEIAHQWWYNLVGNNEILYPWLDEGLTEYSTALFFELNPEYAISKEELINKAYTNFSVFIEVYSDVYGDIDSSMTRNLSEFNSDQEYVYITYVKGMLLFDSLREILGYDIFIKCLQNYFSDYIYKNVTPEDLISSFEKTTRTNLEPYFYSWINGNIILLK